jgi:hypothetical protein
MSAMILGRHLLVFFPGSAEPRVNTVVASLFNALLRIIKKGIPRKGLIPMGRSTRGIDKAGGDKTREDDSAQGGVNDAGVTSDTPAVTNSPLAGISAKKHKIAHARYQCITAWREALQHKPKHMTTIKYMTHWLELWKHRNMLPVT